jgi:hypothetical protein
MGGNGEMRGERGMKDIKRKTPFSPFLPIFSLSPKGFKA